MLDFITRLFDTQGFPPRWSCGAGWQEEPSLGWLHIVSDLAIFGAYTAIPIVIAYFVLRRRDLPFPSVFWLFVVFIFACGTTHLIGAIIFWKPIYRVDGLVKLDHRRRLLVHRRRPDCRHSQSPPPSGPGQVKRRAHPRSRRTQAIRSRPPSKRNAPPRKRKSLAAGARRTRSPAHKRAQRAYRGRACQPLERRIPLRRFSRAAHAAERDPRRTAQLLQQGHVSPDEVTETYHAIERNGKAQVQIIDDLLDMSRIIAGKIRLDVRPVQLSEVIEAAVATIRPAADAKSIRLQQVLDPRSGPVLGDFDRLEQVNLLGELHPVLGTIAWASGGMFTTRSTKPSSSRQGYARARHLSHIRSRARCSCMREEQRHEEAIQGGKTRDCGGLQRR